MLLVVRTDVGSWLHESLFTRSLLQGSELSGWTTGHYTEEGYDIFQNFPDLNSILWDAEDKGMVPKLSPNHHLPIPENFQANSSVNSVFVYVLPQDHFKHF